MQEAAGVKATAVMPEASNIKDDSKRMTTNKQE
jgi:hypothetical protein